MRKKGQKSFKRGFDVTDKIRFTGSWGMTQTTYDQDLMQSLKALRSRSRTLSQNNDYVKRFFALLMTHVIGPKGVGMRCNFKQKSGTIDTKMSDEIERLFKRWGKKGTCDVTGKLSWRDFQRLTLKTVAKDGEALIRFVYSDEYEFGMALQLIDPALLDEDLNEDPTSGKDQFIRMGVELDSYGKPLAYHFKAAEGDRLDAQLLAGQKRIRIPASEILHIFIQDEVTQTRGAPWVHTAMFRLKVLGSYEESELVAARVSSAKMGFFKKNGPGPGYDGDEFEKDGRGNIITRAEPGSFEVLPENVDFVPWTPDHPGGNYAPFIKACLRGISSGLGVSYNSLANDVESVSYSSLRSSLLEERDFYSMIQEWFIESFMEPIYSRWVYAAALKNKLKIPVKDLDRFLEPQFVPRRWAWVDPLKDTKANIMAIQAGIKSRSEVISDQGRNIEDVFAEILAEKKKAEKYGLIFNTSSGEGDGNGGDDAEGEEEGSSKNPNDEASGSDSSYLL
jgi:lambda family phage portal protein